MTDVYGVPASGPNSQGPHHQREDPLQFCTIYPFQKCGIFCTCLYVLCYFNTSIFYKHPPPTPGADPVQEQAPCADNIKAAEEETRFGYADAGRVPRSGFAFCEQPVEIRAA